MFFKPYYLGCLAHASYLIGGDNGDAAVIDPRRDVEEYITDAAAAGLTIRYVIETHLHADFVSGHVEMARRTGAKILLGEKAQARFTHTAARDGDLIPMGDLTLQFVETPGHTPEGITVLVHEAGKTDPKIAFTGDTLFIGDVGRPDLAGSTGFTPEEMARQMYRSLSEKLLNLPETTEVWPAHGAGSSCGRALSNERVSTIGREKQTNPALRYILDHDEAGFVRYATEGLAAAPGYFSFDTEKNRSGAISIEEILAAAKPLSPPDVEALAEDIPVLDTRSIADFGAGHIPGAIHIQLEGKFAPWVGAILSPGSTLVVVADSGREEEAITRLARIGYEQITGWLEGGMEAWSVAGGEIAAVPQLSPSTLSHLLKEKGSINVLDVRAPGEWDEGHIDGAFHIPLNELENRLKEVPEGRLAVMCGSGYRSSIACSLLQRAGRNDVSNASGGWEAWQSAQS
jgi:glyoxylase-like metal-dependent hydrolase (beta-lactamase superfamily II)/rhodanese-related sulfurtransferase